MSEEYEYIRLLTHESLTGVISSQNKVILDKAIHDDPHALAVWQEGVNHYESLQQFINEELRLPEGIRYDIQEAVYEKRRKRRRIISALAAAAAVIAGIVILYPKEQQQPATGIVLQIPGEEIISLTDGQQQAGAVTLNNNAGTLSYQTKTPSAKLNKLSVPSGMTYQMVLGDGSKVWLNAATSLEFPFTFNGETREITINGEAYIEVVKDEAHPFIVHTPGNNLIQVLGTTFNVNTYDSSEARVALVTGAVKVQTATGKSLLLKPGYEAIATANELQTRPFDAENLLAWRQGQYYFSNTNLQEVSKVITRWYGIKVVIDAPINKAFTGDLNRHRPLEEFLKGIHQLMDVEYYYKDGVLHLK
jgi:ferric-dicitrate binding protein FerR (iron transport regulator)